MTLYGAVHIRYRKAIGDWKDIGNDFNANDSPNDDLGPVRLAEKTNRNTVPADLL